MAVGQPSQISPVTGGIDDVSAWLEDIASRVIDQLDSGTKTDIRKTIRDSDDVPELRHTVESGVRYAILQWLLQSTLCEWYAHRGELSLFEGRPRDGFEAAGEKTGNQAFEPPLLADFTELIPNDILAEINWWRYGLLTATNPADDIGVLFEEVIAATERGQHGQFRTPQQVSELMRELAVTDGDRVLDPGMGAGALSVPRDDDKSVHAYSIEQSRTGVLMGVTALALSEQQSTVHEADFFDIDPTTLGMGPDSVLSRTDTVDILPGELDSVIANPPYIANRDLPRDTEYYRQHLQAFRKEGTPPYADGEKRLSGRSDLFVYFLTHATRFLADDGRLVFLLPKKWMETQYGRTLQTFLFDQFKLRAVIDFDDVVFGDAQVNAVVLVADRCKDATERNVTRTRFITLHEDLRPATVDELIDGDTPCLVDEQDYRVTTVDQSVLAARDDKAGPLTQYFQPAGGLQSLQHTEQFTPLSSLADIRYGVKTGNDAVFLLDETDLEEWPIESEFRSAGLSGFSHVDGYTLSNDDSNTSILDLHAYRETVLDGDDMKTALDKDGHPTVRSYLDYCEVEHDITLSSADAEWADPGVLNAPDIVHPYRVHKDVHVYANRAGLVPTNCANGIDVHPSIDEQVLLAYLNSTVHAAFLELWGQSEGGGSLEILTGTLRRMPVADTREITDTDRTAIIEAFRDLTQGESGAQHRLDEAILTVLDTHIDVATLQDTKHALTNDRLPTA